MNKSTIATMALNHATHLENSRSVLLQIERLNKSFGGQPVLRNASVTLNRGEVVLLRGENGSGKTTLLNMLTGHLIPDRGSICLSTTETSVAFHFPQPCWQALNPFDGFCPEGLARLGLSRTWQDPRLFPTETLQDNVAIAMPNQLGEQPQWAIFQPQKVQHQEHRNLQRARMRLAQLGLQGRETSSADRISLGQSKRVMMARTLQTGAQILFLDEPLAGLDRVGMDEIVLILRHLVQEENLTLVIVEHLFNIQRILELATTVWTLKDGEIKVEAPSAVGKELAQAGGGIEEWLNQLQGKDTERSLLHLSLTGNARLSILRSQCNPAGTSNFPAPESPPVLEVENLLVSRGQREVLGTAEGLSFCLKRGDLAVLQAPNGWGKTTLLEAIAGLIPIRQGTIRFNGGIIHHCPPWERAKLGMAFLQSRHNMFPDLTVREVLRLSHVSDPPQGVERFADRRLTDLSGGERQRVLLACLNQRATLYLYDEPFLALDASGLQAVWQQIQPQPDRVCLIVVPSTVMEV
jgi:ABC-type branched-subunit amino acid transport system ATPase component